MKSVFPFKLILQDDGAFLNNIAGMFHPGLKIAVVHVHSEHNRKGKCTEDIQSSICSRKENKCIVLQVV